ncbi:hypothetical protein [Paenibacillus harenae]|uniref:hypothetical protein n=1 Tax=Paenibacillus harenae TaxID=306543 RepID=UPI00278E200F|nr:hypothetical protein [Paenibacillus harenae]MDQ0060739.1 hypothetical protein [Paenibacillus harenae]
MAERPSGKKLTANELVLQNLKESFDRNENVTDNNSNGTNVCVMLVAAEPFASNDENGLGPSLDELKPTHRVRLVLRTTDAQAGTNPYVDGSNFFLAVDQQRQEAVFVWEEESFANAPAFHGGDVASAVLWVKELGELFHVQYKDPFLTSQERFALNGHDDDLK